MKAIIVKLHWKQEEKIAELLKYEELRVIRRENILSSPRHGMTSGLIAKLLHVDPKTVRNVANVFFEDGLDAALYDDKRSCNFSMVNATKDTNGGWNYKSPYLSMKKGTDGSWAGSWTTGGNPANRNHASGWANQVFYNPRQGFTSSWEAGTGGNRYAANSAYLGGGTRFWGANTETGQVYSNLGSWRELKETVGRSMPRSYPGMWRRWY